MSPRLWQAGVPSRQSGVIRGPLCAWLKIQSICENPNTDYTADNLKARQHSVFTPPPLEPSCASSSACHRIPWRPLSLGGGPTPLGEGRGFVHCEPLRSQGVRGNVPIQMVQVSCSSSAFLITPPITSCSLCSVLSPTSQQGSEAGGRRDWPGCFWQCLRKH